MEFIKYFWKKNKYTLLEFAIWIMLFQLLPEKMIALTPVFNVIAIIALLIVSLASTLALVNGYRFWKDYDKLNKSYVCESCGEALTKENKSEVNPNMCVKCEVIWRNE